MKKLITKITLGMLTRGRLGPQCHVMGGCHPFIL